MLTQAKEMVREPPTLVQLPGIPMLTTAPPPPFPQVREPPTLVQLRSETEETQASCQKRYEISQAIKPYHKEQARRLPLMTCLACMCSPQRVRLSRRAAANMAPAQGRPLVHSSHQLVQRRDGGASSSVSRGQQLGCEAGTTCG